MLKSDLEWMTEDQLFCADMFADVVGGYHHISGTIKPCGTGIRLSDYHSKWATFDFAALSRLVVAAHDRAVRVQIVSSSPGRIGFELHRRRRAGATHERHPTIESVIAKLRATK